MMTYILFVLGFVILIKGADMLVDGASAIAKRFNISNLIIGLTIVSFGTSLPELLVSIVSSAEGSAELAIGNVLGSNMANILLILGVAAIIYPIAVEKSTYLIEIPFSLTATLLFGFLANASVFSENRELILSRIDGGILLFFFLLFMGYIYTSTKDKPLSDQPEVPVPQNIDDLMSVKKSIIFISIGIVGLYFGGIWVVDGAIVMAKSLGLSEAFIGLTVIAFGTSVPELVTSAIAAFKKNADIAIGNVVGSNIFNILWILGISSVIRPIPFNVVSNSDVMSVILASTLLILAVANGKKPVISRFEGSVFLLAYGFYIWFLVARG
jgi:cation:H+ antiporter